MSLPNNTSARPLSAPGPDSSLASWLQYLESIHPTEIDLGLDRVLVVFRRLFRRNPNARIVTVGGTNGKGSTVSALEGMLMAAGRTTGAYTSPHLARYNERVRIGGEEISDEAMVRAFEAVEKARGSTSLTYFEFGTLAAFVAFSNAGVQDWLLEVGLGGRLDAVNILDADIAIITSIDLDHQAFLGNDLETIGFEKAGILRPRQTAIFADFDPPQSILQQAAAQKIRLLRPGQGYELAVSADTPPSTCLSIDEDSFSVEVPSASLPVKSLAAAVVAIRKLEPDLPAERIEQALQSLRLPGRFEHLKESPLVIADVGHNPHAARWLSERVSALKRPGQRVIAVYGALGDKDIEGVTGAMKSQVDEWLLAALAVPRGVGCEQLTRRVGLATDIPDARCFETVSKAVATALSEADSQDMVLIFGSFYTVAEGRAAVL
ncbi:bifunctional tetrahydrofolate synthase/dihydrofolate synthase [Marinobacter sp. CHS3-4]|uniref:bifunctional tetrahydrofolate synthase/dihydrofolate synthase n=1 Tax=Marinobacter sp. CHS3-4 TaxID=3045174 RepID=UPI0024B48AAF|nr:bifunctional tetrahydrofolate synthase/dihydrofolate synthase [Marinobacter sp. CHS3-4]MDI9245496.1 bifunctional tetrahydrofolate synthase/dihydrofolate synthase [Marinobacter sp. CHS3-4]